MFTGIVQAKGLVQELEDKGGARCLQILAPELGRLLKIGDSLSTNGCCLTVEKGEGDSVQLTAIRETLAKTNLGLLQVGSQVNLEVAARLDTFLGGHLVSGHVDAQAVVCHIDVLPTGKEIQLELPRDQMKYVISKGSVTLDGCSLTVAEIVDNRIKVCLIPETLTKTILGEWQVGTQVNLEVDLIGKYVEKFFLADPERWRGHFAG